MRNWGGGGGGGGGRSRRGREGGGEDQLSLFLLLRPINLSLKHESEAKRNINKIIFVEMIHISTCSNRPQIEISKTEILHK